MPLTDSVHAVSQLIHMAVAPIFLLAAVSTTLLVLIHRLARIVDRGRTLERQAADGRDLGSELRSLERRAHLIYRALSLGVFASLSVCLLMTVAFGGALFALPVARPAAALFLVALFCYTAALLCLLREVFLAVGSFRLGLHAPAR